jgi:hypothetical protein
VAIAATTALSGCFDNMYPTANADWDCYDGGPDPDPTTTNFCQTDNDLLRVGVLGTLGRWESETQRIHTVLANQFTPTDLTVEWDSPVVLSGDAETDVVYELDEMEAGLAGHTWCDDESNVENQCDQHYVEFNVERFDSGEPPTSGVICHETGHSVGLVHGASSDPVQRNADPIMGCMQTPVAISSLGDHNVDMINATYPQEAEESPRA